MVLTERSLGGMSDDGRINLTVVSDTQTNPNTLETHFKTTLPLLALLKLIGAPNESKSKSRVNP